jgi:hypothetical protein
MTSKRMSLFLEYRNNYWVFRKNSVQEMTSLVRAELAYVAIKRHVLETRGNGVLKHVILSAGRHAMQGGRCAAV